MATLSEQLAQAANALNIAGVPATAQPGVPITASLAPPLTALHFTDVVPTDVNLDFIAKDVVFSNANFNSPGFVDDPAITKIKPLFNLATIPPSLDTSGVGGLIGKIKGTIPFPIPVEAIPRLTVHWEVLDENDVVLVNGDDYLAPAGVDNATLDVVFLPAFADFDGTIPPPATRKIRANVTLTAGTETGTAVIGPVVISVPTIPFPKALVLSRDPDHHGAALVMVPGNSAISTVNHLKSLLAPVRNAIANLTAIVKFAEMLIGIDAASRALEDSHIAFTKNDAVGNLNDIDLIHRPWYEFNDIEAEDELASFVYLAPPPPPESNTHKVEMFNDRRFRTGEGKFTASTGPAFVAVCRTMYSKTPIVFPPTATLVVNNPPEDTFGDELSSIRFL